MFRFPRPIFTGLEGVVLTSPLDPATAMGNIRRVMEETPDLEISKPHAAGSPESSRFTVYRLGRARNAFVGRITSNGDETLLNGDYRFSIGMRLGYRLWFWVFGLLLAFGLFGIGISIVDRSVKPIGFVATGIAMFLLLACLRFAHRDLGEAEKDYDYISSTIAATIGHGDG